MAVGSNHAEIAFSLASSIDILSPAIDCIANKDNKRAGRRFDANQFLRNKVDDYDLGVEQHGKLMPGRLYFSEDTINHG